jgi:hypothetical protein
MILRTTDPIADAERIDWIDETPDFTPKQVWKQTNSVYRDEAIRLCIAEMDEAKLRQFATDFVLLEASEQDFIDENVADLLEYLPAAIRNVQMARQQFRDAFAKAMVK